MKVKDYMKLISNMTKLFCIHLLDHLRTVEERGRNDFSFFGQRVGTFVVTLISLLTMLFFI